MSRFSNAIKSLLDDTDLFERSEWAEFFMVDKSCIDRWLNDEEVPSHEHLFMLYDVIVTSDVVQSPVVTFVAMAAQPARDVSPLGKTMLPNVWEYMNRPAFSDLSTQLANLSPEEGDKLLESLYPAQRADPS